MSLLSSRALKSSQTLVLTSIASAKSLGRLNRVEAQRHCDLVELVPDKITVCCSGSNLVENHVAYAVRLGIISAYTQAHCIY
jgi:hypothetical protein